MFLKVEAIFYTCERFQTLYINTSKSIWLVVINIEQQNFLNSFIIFFFRIWVGYAKSKLLNKDLLFIFKCMKEEKKFFIKVEGFMSVRGTITKLHLI